MKTNQIMLREFMDSNIAQRTKDGFMSATNLLDNYNRFAEVEKSITQFFQLKETNDFVEELQSHLANEGLITTVRESVRGRNGGTWMHPYLFIKFACWLSPKLEVMIIKWVHDNLIAHRVDAGNYYNEMCECISKHYEQFFGKKADPLVYQKEIKFINDLVYGSYDGGRRNEMTELELKLLNDLQKLNIELIKSKQYSAEKRREQLANYAKTFKLLNS